MKITLFIFLLVLSLISSGCFTYYPSRENPDSLKVENNDNIKVLTIYLHNGDTVDVSDYDVKYYDRYKNSEKVFVCTEKDPYEKNQIFFNKSVIKSEKKIIPSEQVKSIIIEKRKTDTVKTVIVASSITILSLAALFLILLGISLSHMHGNVIGG